MKVALICRSFDKNSGQGIYKMAEYLYENIRKFSDLDLQKIESKSKNPYLFDLVESPQNVLNMDFDIYHFLMPESSLPILLSREVRRKSIVTIHDAIIYKIKERRWLSEKYIKMMYWVAKRARIIITPSRQSKEDLVNIVGVFEDKIFTLPWGIDLNHFRPRKFKRSQNDRRIIVGYVGGLGKRKNVDWPLYVAKTLKDEIYVKIAGNGPRLPFLIGLKNKLKLTNVEFVGFIGEEKLQDFYNSLDVFVFPSFYEGFGVPLLEAMACEVPYIIGTNAGIGEVLPIYKIRNFNELRKILLKIKDEEIKPLKNQRRWIIKNKMTWKDHVKKLIKIYSEVQI
jgi:glycosyltransferase involved in cell wall biosynthesis